ncbi:MAG: DUF3291 domain-containing protein [Pseudorhodobacter sp.]
MTLHLAEFNFGTLRHDWDDPRIKGFVDGLDLVNGLAARSPGFVWRLSDEDMDQAQTDGGGVFGDNPRIASTLSVWENVESLEHFVWNTVHRQFYARKAEWYDAIGNGNLVLWWVPAGHRPDLAEGMARWQHREANGDSDHAFGWSYLKEARLWQSHGCTQTAAE